MPEDQRRRRGVPDVESSLRTAEIWSAVLEAVGDGERDRLRVLDLGGGTGGLAVPFAQRGHEVTVVDPSPDALAALARRAWEVGVDDRITSVQGDSTMLASVRPDAGFDLVCCHGVLEYVDDPAASVAALADVLADRGVLSLVTAQRLAAVLSRALAGRFGQAREALGSPDGRWGAADPLPRRFDPEEVRGFVEAAGLHVERAQGVRILSDVVPASYVDTEAERSGLLQLEQELARHPEAEALGRLGAALHVLARRG